MLDRLKPPTKGFVDIVAWVMTALGAFGLVIGVLQFPVLLLVRDNLSFLWIWFLALVQFSLLFVVGRGLRKRYPWARTAVLGMLALLLAWQCWWVLAILSGKALALVPSTFVEPGLVRLPALAMSFFWLFVYVWLGIRFMRPTVRAEFGRRDV